MTGAKLRHIAISVPDKEAVGKLVEDNGGRTHAGPTDPVPENAERKYRDLNGVVVDISTAGWDGAE